MTPPTPDPMLPDRTDGGRFVEQYPDDDFLAALRSEGGLAGTRTVSQHVGCAYETAYKRLCTLAEQDVIRRRDLGPTFLWEVPDE